MYSFIESSSIISGVAKGVYYPQFVLEKSSLAWKLERLSEGLICV